MAKKDILIKTNISELAKRLNQLDQVDTTIYHNKVHPLKTLDTVCVTKSNYHCAIPEGMPNTITLFGWITTDGNCPSLLVALPPKHKFAGKPDEELDRWSWQVYRHGYSFTYNKPPKEIECLQKFTEEGKLNDYWIIGCTYNLSSDYQTQHNFVMKDQYGYYSAQRVWTMSDLHKELKHMMDNLGAQMTSTFWTDYYKFLEEKRKEFKKEVEEEFEALPF